MRNLMKITKALSDQNRVRILSALNDRELCVCQLVALLKLAPSTVSKHIAILRNADMVESRKEGLLVYYFLSEAPNEMLSGVLKWLFDSLKKDKQIQGDSAEIENILKKSPSDICALNRDKTIK